MIQVYLYPLVVRICEQQHQLGNNQIAHLSMGYLWSLFRDISKYYLFDDKEAMTLVFLMRSNTLSTTQLTKRILYYVISRRLYSRLYKT